MLGGGGRVSPSELSWHSPPLPKRHLVQNADGQAGRCMSGVRGLWSESAQDLEVCRIGAPDGRPQEGFLD